MSVGLVIGKFLPLHHGHEELLAVAEQQCDRLEVIVCDAAAYEISAERRIEWIARGHPDARVRMIDGDALGIDDEDSEGWARATIDALGFAPDLVFTSEDYGPRYATYLGAEHVMVDRDRERFPISGTKVRDDLMGNLNFLAPHVRAELVPRIAVVGAESTGKSTLCHDLGAAFGVPFVPEFGRHYTEAMPRPASYHWSPADFHAIARGQERIEDDTARWIDGPLICDTDVFTTAVFAEIFLGERDPELERRGLQRCYDLLLLTDLETPFQQDDTGLRHDGPDRQRMHKRHLDRCESGRTPWARVQGSQDERLRRAMDALLPLLTWREHRTAAPRAGGAGGRNSALAK